MTTRFMNIIDSANCSKEQFESSMESLKDTLETSVKSSSPVYVSKSEPKTGWLRGSLSYPWVLICTIAPAIKEIFE